MPCWFSMMSAVTLPSRKRRPSWSLWSLVRERMGGLGGLGGGGGEIRGGINYKLLLHIKGGVNSYFGVESIQNELQ